VIGVAGLRHVGTKVGFSDIGPEIAISAPGGNCVNLTGACLYPILTTANSGTTTPHAGGSIYTDSFNASLGTSFSSPIVAGTVALMLSAQPALTPVQVRNLIQSSARAFPPSSSAPATPVCQVPTASSADQDECHCTTATCGAGMLDAGAAAHAAALAAVPVQARISVSPASPLAGQAITLSGAGSLVGSGRTIASYRWTLADGGAIVSGFSGASTDSTASITPIAAGLFNVSLTVADDLGAQSTVVTSIAVAPATPAPTPAPSGGGGGGAVGVGWLALLAAAVLALAIVSHRHRCV
jgi:serine protease